MGADGTRMKLTRMTMYGEGALRVVSQTKKKKFLCSRSSQSVVQSYCSCIEGRETKISDREIASKSSRSTALAIAYESKNTFKIL